MSAAPGDAARYAFDDVIVDARSYRVFKGGELRPIGPRAFDLLLDLLAHPERVVEKQELFDRVWNGADVTDNALTRTVKDLRRAIGDHARAPKYIETASGRGYRFIAEVRAMPVAGRVSVLVLPFDDLSARPLAWVTDGLVDELISRLGRLNPDRLTVIARASSVAARSLDWPIGRVGLDLGVDYVVQGSVRRDDDRMQVSVRLTRVSDEHVLWSDALDADVRDAMGVHAQLAASIATHVQVGITEGARVPRVDPVDPDVQAALLEGRYFLQRRTVEDMRKARLAFERAIALAADTAAAYAGLALCHAFTFVVGRSVGSAKRQAEAAVTRALALDDRLPEAHAARAVLQSAGWRFAEAERSLRWAIALDPNDSLARHWLAMFPLLVSGRYQEALDALRAARQLDPLSRIISADIAVVYCAMGEFERAVTQCTESLHLDPNFARAHLYLGWARMALCRTDTALVAFETAARLDGSAWNLAWLGHACARAGREVEARGILDGFRQGGQAGGEQAFLMGTVLAGLGDMDEALGWFERAFEARSVWVVSLGMFPCFIPLRSDRRFAALVRRIRDAAARSAAHVLT